MEWTKNKPEKEGWYFVYDRDGKLAIDLWLLRRNGYWNHWEDRPIDYHHEEPPHYRSVEPIAMPAPPAQEPENE